MSRHVVNRVIVVLCASASVIFTPSTITAQSDQETQTSPIGAWDVRGTDSDGTNWLGTLVLYKGPDGALVGHIAWSGSGGRWDGSTGREYVSATYDPVKRTLTLIGEKLYYAKILALGRYRAVLTEDGAALEKGTFGGVVPGTGVPGEWHAKRIRFDS
jgi:hypothetical protein